jgi:hypothetical protein
LPATSGNYAGNCHEAGGSTVAGTDSRRQDRKETLLVAQGTLEIRLSPGQREFAERMQCSPRLVCVGQAVCFYRTVGLETIRWIVGRNGHVLDWTVFRIGA